MPELNWDDVQNHLTGLVPPRLPILAEMEREAEATDFPILGPAAGYACYQFARLMGARRVFEMGSGFGYSTAWFARAVHENGGGEVHHVVWDQELSDRAKVSLAQLGYETAIHYHCAEAIETLKAAEGPFDLIFNDIDKEAYPEALPIIRSKLRIGGLLIVDNLLWDGKIFDPGDKSPATAAIQELTRKIHADAGWIAHILPIRDGLLTALRVK